MAREVSGFCASSHAVFIFNPVGIRTFCNGTRSPVKLAVYSLLYVVLLIVSCSSPGAFPCWEIILSLNVMKKSVRDNFVQ